MKLLLPAAALALLLSSCVSPSTTPIATQGYDSVSDQTQAAKLGGAWFYRHGRVDPEPNPFVAIDPPGRGEVFWGHGPVSSDVYTDVAMADGSTRKKRIGHQYYRFGDTYYLPLPR